MFAILFESVVSNSTSHLRAAVKLPFSAAFSAEKLSIEHRLHAQLVRKKMRGSVAKRFATFTRLERRSRTISVLNATLIRPRAALTSGVLRSAHGASFAWAVRRNKPKICHAFARFLAKFCALSNADVAQFRY